MIRHFGVLIPSTNTTVEIEYNRLLPPTLQGHVGRLGKGDHTPFSPSQPDDIAYQARRLGTAQVEIVCLAQTSASLSIEHEGILHEIQDGPLLPTGDASHAVAPDRSRYAL